MKRGSTLEVQKFLWIANTTRDSAIYTKCMELKRTTTQVTDATPLIHQ